MRRPSSSFVLGLRCLRCGEEYPAGNAYTCPACGNQGILDVQYDYDEIARRRQQGSNTSQLNSIWRYRDLLPLPPDTHPPHLQIGWTPIYDTPRLARAIGITKLFVKDDGRNPTNSFKDRASAVGVMKAIEFGFDTVHARDKCKRVYAIIANGG